MAVRYEVKALFTNGHSIGHHDNKREALHVYGRTLTAYSAEKTLVNCIVYEINDDGREPIAGYYNGGADQC